MKSGQKGDFTALNQQFGAPRGLLVYHESQKGGVRMDNTRTGENEQAKYVVVS
jgi:hypothetical protein